MTPDEARLEHVAGACGPRVLAYLARRVDPREDAADVWTEVLVTAWRRIAEVPADDGEALAWLLAVARRQLANHRRGQARRLGATERLAAHLRVSTPVPDPDDRVVRALSTLTDEAAELVRLVYWDGLTCEQAATVLGIRPAAGRQRLERARESLRGALEPCVR